LIEDVIDSIDQQIEWKSDPQKQPNGIPSPQLTSQPNGHHCGSNGVDP
jgi:hypothetical protein